MIKALFPLYTFDCRFITSAHSTDQLLFISQDFVLRSCKQNPTRLWYSATSRILTATSCVLIQSSPSDFCRSSCFYHIITRDHCCMYFVCNCLSFIVFFLPIQLLPTCVIVTNITSIHDHNIDVSKLIICPADSILIRPEVDSIAASGLRSI